jgi:hypothetical protein
MNVGKAEADATNLQDIARYLDYYSIEEQMKAKSNA